ncbi:MAG: hypothetical protein MHM6MM_006077 [Cercozoa sp. M6MM]
MSFEQAVTYVRSLPKEGPVQLSTDQKLKFYAFFKQATVGDVQGSQPWAVQVEARAKWDAWNAVKGLEAEEAQGKYVEALTAVDPEWVSKIDA